MDNQLASQRIVRSSLHDTLVSHLRDLIMRGDLRPGDKLPEQKLCERFGVSRTPMREAVKVLAAEGVLRLVINRGAIVAETTPQEIEELFPIMAALEAVAGEQACRNATPAQVALAWALRPVAWLFGTLAAARRALVTWLVTVLLPHPALQDRGHRRQDQQLQAIAATVSRNCCCRCPLQRTQAIGGSSPE